MSAVKAADAMGTSESPKGWMNEIRSFYINRPKRPVSVKGQALWHYLMYRANEVWWRQPLSLHLKEIAGAISMSETAVKSARQELVNAGLLLHEEQGGSRAPHYYLMSSISFGELVHCGSDDKDNKT